MPTEPQKKRDFGVKNFALIAVFAVVLGGLAYSQVKYRHSGLDRSRVSFNFDFGQVLGAKTTKFSPHVDTSNKYTKILPRATDPTDQ